VGLRAAIEFEGSHFGREVIPWGVRWYVAYPASYRQLGEMMHKRGAEADRSTPNRWMVKHVPLLDERLLARKRPVGPSRRMDGTLDHPLISDHLEEAAE
jgi:transposase-like protein